MTKPDLTEQVFSLERRMTEMENSFAQIRLDLKAAGILHDDPYSPPPVDELSEGGQKARQESRKVKKLKKDDPFG